MDFNPWPYDIDACIELENDTINLQPYVPQAN